MTFDGRKFYQNPSLIDIAQGKMGVILTRSTTPWGHILCSKMIQGKIVVYIWSNATNDIKWANTKSKYDNYLLNKGCKDVAL